MSQLFRFNAHSSFVLNPESMQSLENIIAAWSIKSGGMGGLSLITNIRPRKAKIPVGIVTGIEYDRLCRSDTITGMCIGKSYSYEGHSYTTLSGYEANVILFIGEKIKPEKIDEGLYELMDKAVSNNDRVFSKYTILPPSTRDDKDYIISKNNIGEAVSRIVREAKSKLRFYITPTDVDELYKLVPKHFHKISIEKGKLIAVTPVYSIRYKGKTYQFGPYDVHMPLVYTFDSMNCGAALYTTIGVKYHNYMESDVVSEGFIMTNCRRNDSCHQKYSHPHVNATTFPSSLGDCCLGNYVAPMNAMLSEGHYARALLYMAEFLRSVFPNWYSHPDNFYHCADPEAFFNDCKSCKVMSKCRPPIRDYKAVTEDFYCTETNISQPTAKTPRPWDKSSNANYSNEIGGPLYITKYTAEEFDKGGYDPEGFSDTGYHKDTKLDRRGLDKDGRDKDGFDVDGVDRGGFARDGFNTSDMDKEGYSREGYDFTGYNRAGFSADGNQRPNIDLEDDYFANSDFDDWV